MIYESSKDYGTGVISMHFDGESPTLPEIDEYLSENYGTGICGEVEIEMPSTFRGQQNPGVVTVRV